ncbi:MAG: hypothetical protein WBK51_05325 [Polaromonas sp.]
MKSSAVLLRRLLWAGVATYLSSTIAWGQVCVSPQKDGDKTTAGAGEVVNGYFTPAIGTYTAGTTATIALSNARGATGFAVGDMALIIQMQCVDINQTDTDSYGDGSAGFPAHGYTEPSGTCRAGNYEYMAAGAGTSPTSFVIGSVLQKTYVQASPTFT